MKRIRYIVLSAVIFAGGLAFGPASAVLPSALPPFAADLDEGTIDRVDIKAGEIVTFRQLNGKRGLNIRSLFSGHRSPGLGS